MPTLRETIKNIADALREKGVSGTMSLLEMPEKAQEVKSAKYGIGVGVWLGDLDQNGCLQLPSGSYVFYSPFIKEIAGDGGNGPLRLTFRDCNTLAGVELPNLETVYLAGMSAAFHGSSVTYARFPKLKEVQWYGMEGAFQDCTSLTEASFPSLETISTNDLQGRGMTICFENCTSLQTLSFPKLKYIGNRSTTGMCWGCTSLRTLTFGPLESVGPQSLKSIVNGCTNLELVDFSESTIVPPLEDTTAFENTNDTFEIRVPNELYDTWVVTSSWSDPSVKKHIKRKIRGLAFVAKQANSTIKLQKSGSAPSATFVYSDNNGITWNDYTAATNLTGTNVGDTILFRAKTTNSTLATNQYAHWMFVMTGQWEADDSVMYLLANDGQVQGGVPDAGFMGLFYQCTSLTKAPDLPATTVGPSGYNQMFYGCTGLVLPPELPATTLGGSAYREMFRGCTSLTTAPELPATTVPNYVYREMFSGCTSLVNVPEELPATTYTDGHNTLPYYEMFGHCSSLVKAPKLRCTDHGPDMYMFYYCSSLNEIWLDWEGTFGSNQYYWASNVASSGTLHYNGPTTNHSDYQIPAGWNVASENDQILCFTADENMSLEMWASSSSAPQVQLEYTTTGNNWSNFTVADENGYNGTNIWLNAGEKLWIRAKSENAQMGDMWNDAYNYFVVSNGNYSLSGNPMSLLKRNGFTEMTTAPISAFYKLFKDNTYLVDASDMVLPAATVGSWAYARMFEGCSRLKASPHIKVQNFADDDGWGYNLEYMFYNCGDLNIIYLDDYTGDFDSGRFQEWVNGVAYSGMLIYTGQDTTRGTYAIPSNWEISTAIEFVKTNNAYLDTNTTPDEYTKVEATFRGDCTGYYFVTTSQNDEWDFRNYDDQQGNNRFYASTLGEQGGIGGWTNNDWWRVNVSNGKLVCHNLTTRTSDLSTTWTAGQNMANYPLVVGYTGVDYDLKKLKMSGSNGIEHIYLPVKNEYGSVGLWDAINSYFNTPTSGTFDEPSTI